MLDIEREIELLQAEIAKANEVIAKAVRDRKALAKDSPLIIDFNAAVVAARQALLNVEVRLRQLYESKDPD
jgi:hypothetical protein